MKHYERAMYCHKTLLESLERILLDTFLEHVKEDLIFDCLPEGTRDKINTLIYSQNNYKYTLGDIMSDEGFITDIRSYTDVKKSVRDGMLGKTAQFWISYMDHI